MLLSRILTTYLLVVGSNANSPYRQSSIQTLYATLTNEVKALLDSNLFRSCCVKKNYQVGKSCKQFEMLAGLGSSGNERMNKHVGRASRVTQGSYKRRHGVDKRK